MKYSEIKEIKKYVVIQKKLNLFVAESHYFDAKGNRQLTLTDKEEFAEKMSLIEANLFIDSEKNSRDYYVAETDKETDYDEEESFDEEEN